MLDVNDNVPTFQKDAYMGALRENEPSVTQLVRLRVSAGVFCSPAVYRILLSVPFSSLFPWEATARRADIPSAKNSTQTWGSHSPSV